MKILQHFVEIIESRVTIPVSGNNRFIFDTNPDFLKIRIASGIRLTDEQIHLPSPFCRRFHIEPMVDDMIINIMSQFRTFLHQIPEYPQTDKIGMRFLTMIVIVFCHNMINHFIEGRFHSIIRLSGNLSGIFRSVKSGEFLA
ncbi:MAG: hypothetical protein M0R30_09340 [Methanoregula sp.]|uniref:hypothetical protein n=1 Tax=Methanoregula sp. TaxID=2052170 RepID=UPI0025E947C9|nr:hypothetical protein [Methanoregula sp.]MCK9631834.1 hypothetical protein [Methanoregula sp.]